MDARDQDDQGYRERLQAAVDEDRARAPVFPLPHDGPLAGAHAVLDHCLREWLAAPVGAQPGWQQTEGGRLIVHASPGERVPLLHACLERAVWGAKAAFSGGGSLLGSPDYIPGRIARWLLEGELPLGTADRVRMLDTLARPGELFLTHYVPLQAVVNRVAEGFAEPGAEAALRPGALRLRKVLVWLAHYELRWRPLLQRFEAVLSGGGAILDPFEPWAARAIAELEAMDEAGRAPWLALLDHCLSLQQSKPPAKWMRAARVLVAGVGADDFRARAHGWIAAAREGGDEPMAARNSDVARALAWCLADLGEDGDARAVGDLALLCGSKIANFGPRSEKVTNACVAALGEMPGEAAMAQLTRLRAKVKYARAQALIAKTLQAAAERRGLSSGELEELAAPTFAMDEPGVLREEMTDGWTAEVRVVGTTSVETAWISPQGKRQKSSPAALRAAHGEELKALKKTAGEMEEALAAQRARLEALPMEGRAIPYAAWRERYLDHPLLAEMCRRLVWRFETAGGAVSGAWLGGALAGADSGPLGKIGEGTAVRPWHPIFAGAEEIAAWRAWLERHGVTQPFKQAHREVYRLTDAERDTAIYSNRFAAHVLRQHQLAALARTRGWQYQLQGAYDRWSAPTLRLPSLGLRVEFRVTAAEGDDALAPSGVALYVATDQVRFLDETGCPVRLEEVPPLAFSEAMRDVDLFVGVASVGTDPTWVDAGPAGALGAYWTGFAFGALSATAETRREVLQRLVPRLRIAGQCSLEERFLVVRGALRTYRIHLGSGNVLMEPGSEYLCIVPDRGSKLGREAEALPLPFEGDAMLSLILSKAFLLADDTRIADPVIVRQIRLGQAALDVR